MQDATMFDVTLTYGVPAIPKPELAQIQSLQDQLATLPQIECEPEHLFAPKMYVRRLPIQAGAVVIGKMHRHSHPVMLIKGETTILTDKGMERISAPHVWISEPRAKRVLYTHTDCEFVTVHLNETDERDLDVLEAEIIIPEPQVALPEQQKAISEFADALQAVYA